MNIYESIKNSLNESRLPNISEFIYDLDVDKGNAWGVTNYGRTGSGRKIIEVYRNGYSENTAEDIKNIVEEKYPQLEGVISRYNNAIRFYLKESEENYGPVYVWRTYLNGDPSDDYTSYEEALKDAKEKGCEEIEKYTWYNSNDYDNYKDANRIETVWTNTMNESEAKHYNLMGDDVILDIPNKTMTVNGKTFTFDKMDEFVKASRGTNRIYKPMALLLYIDYKNGKLRNWESESLNESTKNFTPALLDKYVENYNKSQKWIKGRRRPREKQPEDFEWRYMAGNIDGMKVRGEEETQIFDTNTGEYLGPYSKYNSIRESSGDRYLITKHNRSPLAPYGIWDTKERKFVSKGEKGEYKNGVYEKSPLELELDKRNEKARQDKMKETEEDKPDEHLLDLLRTKDKIARDTDMPDDIAYNMMEKIDNEMINAYSIKEIEKAEKYLGLE